MAKETTQSTIMVALTLCVVCSIIVSTAAVMLRPSQEANKALDFKRNILMAAGMATKEDGSSVIRDKFKNVTVKLVDLETGKFSDAENIEKYDQWKASKDPAKSIDLSAEADVAKINNLEKYSKVYLAQNAQGGEMLILPVRGYGLWSTLYGFLALESDLETIVGLGFYDHKETPGLGGEVDNPRWKALWQGKKLYDDNGKLAISVIKGAVSSNTSGAEHKVDGLSGATLTSKGVDNLLKFWLGPNGFGPFLQNYKGGKA